MRGPPSRSRDRIGHDGMGYSRDHDFTTISLVAASGDVEVQVAPR